jgi:Rrf2 family protein
MITKRAKYAIKALLHLARHRGQGPLQANVIAEQQQIPLKFLETILLQLRNCELIRSKVGKGGGHELIGDPATIDLLTVLRAIDGPMAPLPCLSKTAYARCDDCPDEKTCGARLLFKDIHDRSLALLGTTTLADSLDGCATTRKATTKSG